MQAHRSNNGTDALHSEESISDLPSNSSYKISGSWATKACLYVRPCQVAAKQSRKSPGPLLSPGPYSMAQRNLRVMHVCTHQATDQS